MRHHIVFKVFRETLPQFADNAAIWFPNGKNSIRVRETDGSEYVFTLAESEKEWQFETVSNFIRRLKGGLKNAGC